MHAQMRDSVAAPLVFSPSRYAQSALDAPTAVSVLTSDDIWRFGYRSLDEVLGAVRGMFGLNDRNYAYLSIRGVQRSGDFNTRLLLLVDGRRIGGLLDDFASIGTDALVDVDAIDRVEVTHGPGSSLYGTNAMYAIINVITRRASQDSGTVARIDLQSFESVRGSLRSGRRTASGVDLFGTVSGSRSRGPTLRFPEFATTGNPRGAVSGLDDESTARALGTLRVGDFHLLAAASNRDKGIPTAPYATIPFDDRTRTAERLGLLSGQYEHVFGDLSRLWATVTASANLQRGGYAYPDVLNQERYRSYAGMFEAQYLRFFGAGHTLIVGGEGRSSAVGSIEVTSTNSFVIDAPAHVYAAFAQSELRLGESVTAHVGIRHDWYSRDLSAWSPRVGLTWRPQASTAVKASYGRAFRAPNGYELYYNDNGASQLRPQTSLRPERLRNTELSIEHGFGPSLHGSVALYDSHTRNLIGLVPLDTSALVAFANLDPQRFRGAELTLRAIPARGTRIDAALALQHTHDNASGRRMTGSPSMVGRVGLAAPLASDRLLGVAELRGMSARQTLDDATLRGFATLNLGVQFGKAIRGPTVHVMAWNVFGATVMDPGGEEHVQDSLPRDGRTLRVALRWGF
jgi:outer membrane receptor protein involved in Fe transport